MVVGIWKYNLRLDSFACVEINFLHYYLNLESVRVLLLFSPSHSLPRRSTVLFVKLAVLQLVMTFPTFCDTLRRITVFKREGQFFLSPAR